MITEYLAYAGHQQIEIISDDLRRHGETYSDYDIQYAYVLSDTDKIVGVLRLRDLLMTAKHRPVGEVLEKAIVLISDTLAGRALWAIQTFAPVKLKFCVGIRQ
jgi:Mg/Co/Ni transporter MgtE